jgi:hypothetical protein
MKEGASKRRPPCWGTWQKHDRERSSADPGQQPQGRTGEKKHDIGHHGELLRFWQPGLSPLGRAMCRMGSCDLRHIISVPHRMALAGASGNQAVTGNVDRRCGFRSSSGPTAPSRQEPHGWPGDPRIKSGDGQ